ncbi:MAG: glycosyltransferase [Planctomycetes bacterium]|nr:glycosyltransferase [Planctomycetota bacterium]
MSSGEVVRRDRVDRPTLSVCIPQHERTQFLLLALESLARQTHDAFEVCISDDCSKDGGTPRILEFLKRSRLSFAFARQERNGRYDRNLRASLALARGEYCVLLGNDDGLAGPDTLALLARDLATTPGVAVAVTNYRDAATGRLYRRARTTRGLAGGPALAARTFRNFSFVSGLVLATEGVRRHATDRWDGSEFYQMFLAARMLAEGGALLSIDRIVVDMGLQVPDQRVDSYARRPRTPRWPIVERRLNLDAIGRLVLDAILPFARNELERQRLIWRVMGQLYLFTYPFWLVEYRRVQSWSYACGVALGMRPRHSLQDVPAAAVTRAALGAIFGGVTAAGLTIPLGAFERLHEHLYGLAKAAAGARRD